MVSQCHVIMRIPTTILILAHLFSGSNCVNSIVRRKVLSRSPVIRQYGGHNYSNTTSAAISDQRIMRLRSLVKKKIKKIIRSRPLSRDKPENTLNPNVISNIENGQLKVQEESANRYQNITSETKIILTKLFSSMVLKNAARDRDSRFLSLFTVVRFPNSMCLTSSNDNGTCYTQQVGTRHS